MILFVSQMQYITFLSSTLPGWHNGPEIHCSSLRAWDMTAPLPITPYGNTVVDADPLIGKALPPLDGKYLDFRSTLTHSL